MSKIKFILLAVAVALLAFGPAALAQTSKGFIVGNVVDPNGAVVTGATVKATNKATGVSRDTVTQSDGAYRFDAVDPGTYQIDVTATGFRAVQRDNVTVAASQTAEVTLALEVGTGGETVNVTSNDTGTILQTQDGARVNTIDNRQITELPNGSLNPISLARTLPGVTVPLNGSQSGSFSQGPTFAINGLRPRSNNQLIDGLDNNDNSINGQFLQPTLRDGYSEVTILTSDYSAEYGRAGGGVFNVVTRGGSNDVHGTVYDIIQSQRFSTLTPGEKRNGLTKIPQLKDNTVGFSIGGPIRKNKMFFFGTFQPDFFRQQGTASARVPTAAGLATLLSQPGAATNVNLQAFVRGLGGLTGTTNLFNVNTRTNGTGQSVEFGTATVPSPSDSNDYQGLARVDYTPNERDSFAFRYTGDKNLFPNQFGAAIPINIVDTPAIVQNAYINYTRVLSSRATNEFRFGFGRFDVIFGPRDPAALTAGPTIGFAGAGLGQGVSGVGLSSGFPQGRIFNNFQIQDTVGFTFGNNTVRVGTDLNVQRSKQLVPFNSRGSLTFAAGGGFTGLGNFLEGFSGSGGSASIVFGSQVTYPNAFFKTFFVNDQYRLRPNLTLNLGLRYENEGTPFNVVAFPAFGGLFAPLTTVARQKSDNNNFAPRVSFAYQPKFGNSLLGRAFGNERTVIRGGFAVNYDFFFNNILSNTAGSSPNVFGATLIAPTGQAAINGGRGFANFGPGTLPTTGTRSGTAGAVSIPTNLVNPISYVYNFGFQRQLPGNLVADVAYVGSRGTKLFINEQVNPGINGVRLNPARGSILLRTNGGDSHYNSLQTRLERGFRNGFLLRAAYTFSKAIDDVNSDVFTTTGGTSIGSQPGNSRADRGLAAFDAPHRFSLASIYSIPTPGFAKGNSFLKLALGGFQLSGIYTIQSGQVETPFVGGIDLNGDLSSFNDRPAIGNPNAPANSVAFSNALNGTNSPTGFSNLQGNPISLSNARYIVSRDIRTGLAGRNTLRGPRSNNLDMTLAKRFEIPFGDKTSDLQFRAEFFNVLNHPFFSAGNGDVTNTFFNDPFNTNDGTRRTGRIQVVYSF